MLPRSAAAFDLLAADLERRIVEAELAGRRTVADVLARQLEAHRATQASAGNVVPIVAAKARRRGA